MQLSCGKEETCNLIYNFLKKFLEGETFVVLTKKKKKKGVFLFLSSDTEKNKIRFQGYI